MSSSILSSSAVDPTDYKNPSHPNKVFVGGVSPSATEREIFDLFNTEIGGVMHIQMGKAEMDPTRYHKGYAFVVFATQEQSQRAISKCRLMLLDKEVEVKAIDTGPRKPRTPGMPGQGGSLEVPENCKLFIALKAGAEPIDHSRGLDEKELEEHFNHYGVVKKVVIVKDKVTGAPKGFGFIYFDNPNAPLVALKVGREHTIGGHSRIECKQFSMSAPRNVPATGGMHPSMGMSPYGGMPHMYGAMSAYGGMPSGYGSSPYGPPGGMHAHGPYGSSVGGAYGRGVMPPMGGGRPASGGMHGVPAGYSVPPGMSAGGQSGSAPHMGAAPGARGAGAVGGGMPMGSMHPSQYGPSAGGGSPSYANPPASSMYGGQAGHVPQGGAHPHAHPHPHGGSGSHSGAHAGHNGGPSHSPHGHVGGHPVGAPGSGMGGASQGGSSAYGAPAVSGASSMASMAPSSGGNSASPYYGYNAPGGMPQQQQRSQYM